MKLNSLPQDLADSARAVSYELSARRVEKGLLQKQVADFVGVTKKKVSQLERFQIVLQDDGGGLLVPSYVWEISEYLKCDDSALTRLSDLCLEYSIMLTKVDASKAVGGILKQVRRKIAAGTLRSAWFECPVLSVYIRHVYVGSPLLCADGDLSTAPEKTLVVAYIIVLGRARGLGLYSQLLAQLEALAKEKGYGLQIECAQASHEEIYAKRGFIRRGGDWFKRVCQ